jgi:DNA-binding NtrC family response regulator/pSer/pThr/pTyr-binding forkhead associated (FHA) protein
VATPSPPNDRPETRRPTSRLDAPLPEQDSPPRSTPWVLEAANLGQRVALDPRNGEVVAGYSSSCGIILRTRGVSRRHAALRIDADLLLVEDLGSRNGTFVNGIRVEKAHLKVGDRLSLGPVSLRVGHLSVDDANLGLVTGTDLRPSSEEDTDWFLPPGPPGAALELPKRLLLLLGGSEPNVADALRLAAAGVLATGSAVGEWRSGGEPSLLATFGNVSADMEHPRLQQFFAQLNSDGATIAANCFRASALTSEPALFCCGFYRCHGPLLGVVFRGPIISDTWKDVGEIFLNLLDRAGCHKASQSLTGFPTLQNNASPLGFIRGTSAAMQAVYRQLERTRDTAFPVLVRGETGVGKEHIVRLLHDQSRRRKGPFVAVNCAAIPSDLLEAEMFGIGRGVASGVQERVGRFLQASSGTLFLDEVAEMALPLQAKLLRAVESGKIRPLGCDELDVDIRIVAATNADLRERVGRGLFRADFYYRISAIEMSVPPLRERIEDIPIFLQHFLDRFSKEAGRCVRGITVSALRQMCTYHWPGNIRELQNEVRRLVLACEPGCSIDSTLLQDRFRDQAFAQSDEREHSSADLRLETRLAYFEKDFIRDALQCSKGSQSGAARLLGISRNGLVAKMIRHGIKVPQAVETN